MLDSIILVIMLVILWLIYLMLNKIIIAIENVQNAITGPAYPKWKSEELNAEALLADDGEVKGFDKDGKLIEESLYRNKEGKYSYKVYDENKKRREKEKNPDDYIDDFEKVAEELEKAERKSKYAR